jgi:hypothetical protein
MGRWVADEQATKPPPHDQAYDEVHHAGLPARHDPRRIHRHHQLKCPECAEPHVIGPEAAHWRNAIKQATKEP